MQLSITLNNQNVRGCQEIKLQRLFLTLEISLSTEILKQHGQNIFKTISRNERRFECQFLTITFLLTEFVDTNKKIKSSFILLTNICTVSNTKSHPLTLTHTT